MYDFIGDVHGHSNLLRQMLEKLGYREEGGVYSHPTKKAFFLGDIVDDGPDVGACVQIVKSMIENGAAEMVMGNHEYNLLCYYTPIRGSEGEYLRSHSKGHTNQCRDSLKFFTSSEGQEALSWIKTLPLWFENDDFRAIHACWHDDTIEYLMKHLPDGGITDDFLQEATEDSNCELFDALELVLKGPEAKLPDGKTFKDSHGEERDQIRLAWWNANKVIAPKQKIEMDISKIKNPYGYYPKAGKRVFFGHYGMAEDVYQTSKNAICLDFDVIGSNRLLAYSQSEEIFIKI